MTARDAAAPNLLHALDDQVSNDGPASVIAPAVAPAPEQVARAGARPLNDLQRSLSTAAVQLPTIGADVAAHIQRLTSAADVARVHDSVADAAADVAAHVRAFLGKV